MKKSISIRLKNLREGRNLKQVDVANYLGLSWKQGEMVTVPEMVALLKEEGEEWAYPTVATFLRRLAEKKILGSIKN